MLLLIKIITPGPWLSLSLGLDSFELGSILFSRYNATLGRDPNELSVSRLLNVIEIYDDRSLK